MTKHCDLKISILLLLISFEVCSAVEIDDASGLRIVALSGQLAPGTTSRTFGSFDGPVINSYGETAFVANLNCCGAASGVWSTGSGNLELIGLVGQSPPSDSSKQFSGYHVSQLDDLGRTTMRVEMTGIPPEFDGVWTAGNGQDLIPIALSGQQVDGAAPGRKFFGIAYPSVSTTGYIAGVEAPQGSSTYKLLWVSNGDGLARKLLEAGDPVPFAASGTVYGNHSGHVFDEPVINAKGQIGLRAAFASDDLDEPNLDNHLIRVNPDGSTDSILSSGAQAPGFAPGVRFGAISVPAMNDHGDFAFGAVIDPFSRDGIWLKNDGATPLQVVLRNDPAPDFPGAFFDDVFFNSDNRMPVFISNLGDVAFSAVLAGGAFSSNLGESVWIKPADGELKSVVVEGQVAPGTNGAVFHSMTSTIGDLVSQMAMNTYSQLAILCTVQINGDDRPGLFATDRDGELHSIVVFGEFIEIAPGILKQVDSISFESPLERGQGSGINDRGEIAFAVRFSDGSSGAFVSSLVAIPEPSTVILGWMAVVVYSAVLRRR